MGVKTTMAGVTYAANHIAAATKAGHNVTSIASDAQLQATELIRTLQLLVSTMQAGDANITTINNQIAALS
jgi:DNA-binding phage protein